MLNFVILAGAIFVGVFAALVMLVLVIFNIMTSKTYLRKIAKMTEKLEEVQEEMLYGDESK